MSDRGPPDLSPAEGRLVEGVHVYPLRVYYEDTDAGGIVYHANYLRFCERARNEMMRCLGYPHAAMVRDEGVAFAVRRCEIEFIRPAVLDDALEVETRMADIGAATLDAVQTVRRPAADGKGMPEELARLTLRLACINQNGRPVRLPVALRRVLGGLPAGRPSGRPSAGSAPE